MKNGCRVCSRSGSTMRVSGGPMSIERWFDEIFDFDVDDG